MILHSQKETCVLYQRSRTLYKKYRLTLVEVTQIELRQDGKCAICHEEFNEKPFHVDHCHESGKVRGLLCHTCNVGLGSFHDNKTKLLEAINYLELFGG